MTARHRVVIVGGGFGALFHCTISFFGRSRPERTITAQQIFARRALAASVRAGEFDE